MQICNARSHFKSLPLTLTDGIYSPKKRSSVSRRIGTVSAEEIGEAQVRGRFKKSALEPRPGVTSGKKRNLERLSKVVSPSKAVDAFPARQCEAASKAFSSSRGESSLE